MIDKLIIGWLIGCSSLFFWYLVEADGLGMAIIYVFITIPLIILGIAWVLKD